MKFFILAVLVAGAVMADQASDMEAKRNAATKILTTDSKDMTFCHTDTDCSSLNDKPVCDGMMRLCKPRDAPSFAFIAEDCTNDENCKPGYRCHASKCHFTGPKACDSEADCVRGLPAINFQCKILQNSAPGKRCYAQCNADKDCYQCEGDKCRVPQALQAHLGCCEGFCQKKMACNAANATASA